ncbi:MAG: hypothetical protein ABI270_03705 [Nitrosospira sp.]
MQVQHGVQGNGKSARAQRVAHPVFSRLRGLPRELSALKTRRSRIADEGMNRAREQRLDDRSGQACHAQSLPAWRCYTAKEHIACGWRRSAGFNEWWMPTGKLRISLSGSNPVMYGGARKPFRKRRIIVAFVSGIVYTLPGVNGGPCRGRRGIPSCSPIAYVLTSL